MDFQKPVVIFDDGHTKLWGFNAGRYPQHHFITRPSSTEEERRLPLWLDCAGWDDWAEGCERRRVNSEILAIEYVREGVFEFEQNGRFYRVSPGGVFLVKPGGTCMMRTCDKFARKRTMIARGPCVEAILNSCGLAALDVAEGADESFLDRQFDRAEALFRDLPAGFRREASAIVYETLLALGEASSRNSLPKPVRLALELFERRLDGRVSLPELSVHCGCSPVTLQRLFRRSLGQTPLERFIGMKMELAKSMLLLSSESIKEISRRLGYSSQLYFSTDFKKRVGLSPLAWSRARRRPARGF